MVETNLQELVDALRKEEAKLHQQREAATRTISNIERELSKIENAIAALIGNPNAMRGNRRSGRAYTGEEVVFLIEQILQEDRRLTEPDLKTKVAELAKKEGRSRAGLHLRFKTAIRDARFEFNGAHWQLKQTG